ncbi:DUF305 domain-containing protein [Cnuella takakiae]|nr:DUF305 domain-containing protein [Cnuella takakiae]
MMVFSFACTDSRQHQTAPVDPTASEPTKNSVRPPKVENTMLLAQATNNMLDSLRLNTYTGNTDLDFLHILKKHQLAALEMYQTVMSKGESVELKTIAQNISDHLKMDMDLLDKQVANTNVQEKSDFSEKALMLLDSLTVNGLSMHGAYLDLDFATMMMQHHQNAIALATLYRKYGKNKKLLQFTQKMIAAHKSDITRLRNWKTKNYPGVS